MFYILNSRWTDSDDSNTGHSQELKYLHFNVHESQTRVAWRTVHGPTWAPTINQNIPDGVAFHCLTGINCDQHQQPNESSSYLFVCHIVLVTQRIKTETCLSMATQRIKGSCIGTEPGFVMLECQAQIVAPSDAGCHFLVVFQRNKIEEESTFVFDFFMCIWMKWKRGRIWCATFVFWFLYVHKGMDM